MPTGRRGLEFSEANKLPDACCIIKTFIEWSPGVTFPQPRSRSCPPRLHYEDLQETLDSTFQVRTTPLSNCTVAVRNYVEAVAELGFSEFFSWVELQQGISETARLDSNILSLDGRSAFVEPVLNCPIAALSFDQIKHVKELYFSLVRCNNPEKRYGASCSLQKAVAGAFRLSSVALLDIKVKNKKITGWPWQLLQTLVFAVYCILFPDKSQARVPLYFGMILVVFPCNGIFWISGNDVGRLQIRHLLEKMYSGVQMPPMIATRQDGPFFCDWTIASVLSLRTFEMVPYVSNVEGGHCLTGRYFEECVKVASRDCSTSFDCTTQHCAV